LPVLALLVTGLVMVAFPLVTQGEEKVTEIGIVAGKLFIRTGTVTLLVP
jgi:hypothetical protein